MSKGRKRVLRSIRDKFIRLILSFGVVALSAVAYNNCGGFSPSSMSDERASSDPKAVNLAASCDPARAARLFETNDLVLNTSYGWDGLARASSELAPPKGQPAWLSLSSSGVPAARDSAVLLQGKESRGPGIRIVLAELGPERETEQGSEALAGSRWVESARVAGDELRKQAWFAGYGSLFRIYRLASPIGRVPAACLSARDQDFGDCLSSTDDRAEIYASAAKWAEDESGPTYVVLLLENGLNDDLRGLSFVRDRVSVVRAGSLVSRESVGKAILHQILIQNGHLLPREVKFDPSVTKPESVLGDVFYRELADSFMNRLAALPMFTPFQNTWLVGGMYREFPLLAHSTPEGEVDRDAIIRAYEPHPDFSAFSVEWFVDGARQDRDGQSELSVRSLGLSEGRHEIRAVAHDRSPFAIDETVARQCFSRAKTWDVTVAYRYEWRTTDWSACPTACGVQGQQTRQASCARDDGMIVADSFCSGQKPSVVRTCEANTYPRWEGDDWSQCSAAPEWKISEWGKCLESGGRGRRTRDVVCINTTGSKTRSLRCMSCDGQRLSDAECAGAETLSSTETCARECTGSHPATEEMGCDFHTYRWSIGEWSSCSAACGAGQQTRQVQCERDDGRVVSDTLCEGSKPQQSQSCDAIGTPRWETGDWGTCSADPTWQIGAWGACSSSCGTGEQRRQISCINKTGEHRRGVRCLSCDGKAIDSRYCDQSSRPPEAKACEKSCEGASPAETQACTKFTYEWKASEWTQCSSTPQWQIGAWGSCSSECGTGTQARSVSCLDKAGEQARTTSCMRCDGSTVSSTLCGNAGPEPAKVRECERACEGAAPATAQSCQIRTCAEGEVRKAGCGALPHGASCSVIVSSETSNPNYPVETSPQCPSGATPFETVSYSESFICDDGSLKRLSSTPRYFKSCESMATPRVIDPSYSTCPK